MIKANEIRVGNWLIDPTTYHPQQSNKYIQVETIGEVGINISSGYEGGIDVDVWFEKLEPIPLTSEILEGCGFKWENENHKHIQLDIEGDNQISFYFENGAIKNLQLYNKDCTEYFVLRSFVPKYLHQLQNLYFALTGEELPIKL